MDVAVGSECRPAAVSQCHPDPEPGEGSSVDGEKYQQYDRGDCRPDPVLPNPGEGTSVDGKGYLCGVCTTGTAVDDTDSQSHSASSLGNPQHPAATLTTRDDTDGLGQMMKGLMNSVKPKGTVPTVIDRKPVQASDTLHDDVIGTAAAGTDVTGAAAMEHSTDSVYDFSHPKRGSALIFVNDIFEELTGQPDRAGAEYDGENFSTAFKALGFDVLPFKNLRVQEIINILAAYAKKPHDDEDCFVCAFSTHGDQAALDLHRQRQMDSTLASDIIYGKDSCMAVSRVIEHFTDDNCPSLSGKPKIFFFQACRGNLLADTVTQEHGVTKITSKSVLASKKFDMKPVDIPLHKDFLLAFSAPPGFYSFRRSRGDRAGSWFVLALCDVICQYGHQCDLETLMALVSQQIVHTEEFTSKMSRSPEFHNRKIVPWIASMLVKEVYFTTKAKVKSGT